MAWESSCRLLGLGKKAHSFVSYSLFADMKARFRLNWFPLLQFEVVNLKMDVELGWIFTSRDEWKSFRNRMVFGVSFWRERRVFWIMRTFRMFISVLYFTTGRQNSSHFLQWNNKHDMLEHEAIACPALFITIHNRCTGEINLILVLSSNVCNSMERNVVALSFRQ